MADHRRPVQPLFGDITGQLLGHRGGDGTCGIVPDGRACKTLHMNAVDAVAALQLLGQQVKGVGRRGQAGDHYDVADRVPGSIDADMEPARLEVGMGMGVAGFRGPGLRGGRVVAMVAVRLGKGGRAASKGDGPGDGGDGGQGLHGLSLGGRAIRPLLSTGRHTGRDWMRPVKTSPSRPAKVFA